MTTKDLLFPSSFKMKFHYLLVLLFLNLVENHCQVSGQLFPSPSPDEVKLNEDLKLFDLFRQKYNKTYQPGTLVFLKRFKAFRSSLKRIRRLNRDNDISVMYGITEFADLSPQEFREQLITLQNQYKKSMSTIQVMKASVKPKFFDAGSLRKSLSDLPSRIDWRERGIVSRVRNQGKCGACWAYSTVETVESMVALRTMTDVMPLSVQQVIDCGSGSSTGNHGCDGGDTCAALKWMKESKALILTEIEYPMRNQTGQCMSRSSSRGVLVSNYTCSDFSRNEGAMVRQLALHGPLTVAVDATSWQDYLGGVIQYNCETKRNHAVQVVGYDLTAKVPYYIVKNTWGREYGHEGFLYIAIGKNLCGIANEVSAVDVTVINKNGA